MGCLFLFKMEQIFLRNRMWEKISEINARIEQVNKLLDTVEETIHNMTNLATNEYVESIEEDLRGKINEIELTPGPQGEKGDKGDKGDKGEKGDDGKEGAQGSQGVRGEQGEKGAQGDQGELGEMGPQGEQGPQDKPGIDGLSGR
jgi:hypothetical protein